METTGLSSLLKVLKYKRTEEYFVSTLFLVLNSFMEPETGATMLNNIIENIEQRGHENILQFRFHCNNEQLFLLILDSFPVHKRIRNKV